MSIPLRLALNIRSQIEQLLPAQPCLLCGAASRQHGWCPDCDASLPRLTIERCPMCALPATGGMLCGHCLRHPMQFDRTCAALAYAFPVDKLIQALKFDEQLLLARRLAEAMQAHISVRPDAIVPMPLHPERLCQRGFNQSQELARPLAHHLDVPLLHACRRIRNTAPQSGLPWRERKKNLRKAFVCEQDLRGQHVAIVDDVMTTGASLNELARVLRQAGAREISAWVVARTLPHSR